jgi:DNA-binding NarL/FixJ family response regulator
MNEIIFQRALQVLPKFTRNQEELLRLICQGKDYPYIASVMQKKTSTVRMAGTKLRWKLKIPIGGNQSVKLVNFVWKAVWDANES